MNRILGILMLTLSGVVIPAGAAAAEPGDQFDFQSVMVPMADGVLLVGIGLLTRSAASVFAGELGLLGGLVCLLAHVGAPSGVATE